MNNITPSLFVLLGLLIGTYCISVMHYLVLLGPRRIGAAVLLPGANAIALLRQENVLPRGADTFLLRSSR
jgi:hypothetical protein